MANLLIAVMVLIIVAEVAYIVWQRGGDESLW